MGWPQWKICHHRNASLSFIYPFCGFRLRQRRKQAAGSGWEKGEECFYLWLLSFHFLIRQQNSQQSWKQQRLNIQYVTICTPLYKKTIMKNAAYVCTVGNGAVCGICRQPQRSPPFQSSAKSLQELAGPAAAGMVGYKSWHLQYQMSMSVVFWAREHAVPQIWLSCFPGVCKSFGITRHI